MEPSGCLENSCRDVNFPQLYPSTLRHWGNDLEAGIFMYFPNWGNDLEAGIFMYFPTKQGAKEPQNPQNDRVGLKPAIQLPAKNGTNSYVFLK